MSEEEEEHIRSEKLDVKRILLHNNEDCLARMEQIKVVMRPNINHLFKCNLEENQRKEKLIDFIKLSYNSMKTFIKKHIILKYNLDNYNVSSDYTSSIYDDVIGESILKNKLLLFLEMKKREHKVMIKEPNPIQLNPTHLNPTEANPNESNPTRDSPK